MESASQNAHGADTSTENDLLAAVEDGRRFESLVIDLASGFVNVAPRLGDGATERRALVGP